MEKKWALLMGIVLVLLVTTGAEAAERVGMMLYVYPNVTQITNSISGDGGWFDGGNYLHPNTTFADNVNISNGWLEISGGYTRINATSCNTLDTDPSGNIICGTDETGGGGGSNLNTSTDDPYLYNDSTTIYLNETELNRTIEAIDTATNTSVIAYIDTQDSAQDECSEITNCVVGAITEIDNWATNINNYPATCNSTSFVRTIGDTLTCEEPVDTNTQLSQEEVEDYAGTMWTGNTETRATVTYQDADGTIDIVVDDMNDDTPDDDSEVPDDITVDSTKNINTTVSVSSLDLYVTNGTVTWRIWVNATGYLIIEEI